MPRTRHLAVRRVWVQRPHGPRWSVSQLLIPSPWWWGAYVGMATAPMVTGMEGYAGAGHGPHHHHHRHALHLLTTSHTTNTAIRAHGHHAIWLMTANGPPPISVIQTSGSSSAMACIHPYPSVHHPLRIPTPWRWGAYGGRAMVLMVLGMEGHTLPWPTPPPAPPLRMEVATTTPLRTIPSSLCASPWHHGGQHHNGPTPIPVIQTSGPSTPHHGSTPAICTPSLCASPRHGGGGVVVWSTPWLSH